MGVRLLTLVRKMRREVPAGDSDADLLARFARNGDSSAFELLVWRHGAMVLSACQRILAQCEDAEDAFQATFLVLARKAGGIGRGTALPAWLHRVAVRIATRFARSRKPVAKLEADPVSEPMSDPVAIAETLRALDEEIDRLPERCRRAVVLCYLEGLTAAEAASRLGCPTGTVESRLASARKRLHAALARRGFALPVGVLAALGPVALAPEAVARVACAGVLFGCGTVNAVVSERSVRLAKGVLAMWRTQTWAAFATVVLATITAATGFAWAQQAPDDLPLEPAAVVSLPPVPVAAVLPIEEPDKKDPKAQPRSEQQQPPVPVPAPAIRAGDSLAGEYWTGKPVWVASTSATLYDISADGKRFLLGDRRKLGVFDRDSAKMLWQLPNTTVHDAKFSPDGKTIASGEWEKGLIFYDAATGGKVFAIDAGEERPWQVHYRSDGTLLYQTSWSSFSPAPPWKMKYSIVHFDPVAKKERGKVADTITYSGTNPWLWHRGASFTMEHLTAHGTNGITHYTVNYTDPISGKATPTIKLGPTDEVLDVSPDAKTILVATGDEQPRLGDVMTGKTAHTLDGHKRFVTSGAFSPDGKLVVTVTGTQSNSSRRGVSGGGPPRPTEFAVWNAVTGKLIKRTEFLASEHDFTTVSFSPNSKFFVAASREGPGGKFQGHYAFGTVPFDRTGGVAVSFPEDETKSKPMHVLSPGPAGGNFVSDPLDRLIETLVKSDKSANDKIDAIFLASIGRFPSEGEQKRVKERYGEKLSSDVIRLILKEIAATPEFAAHIGSLQKRQQAKPAPAPGSYPGGPTYPSGWPIPQIDHDAYISPPRPKKP